MLLESTGLSSEYLPQMFVHISMITCNLLFSPPLCWTEFVVTCLVLQSADWAKLWSHQIFVPVFAFKSFSTRYYESPSIHALWSTPYSFMLLILWIRILSTGNCNRKTMANMEYLLLSWGAMSVLLQRYSRSRSLYCMTSAIWCVLSCAWYIGIATS